MNVLLHIVEPDRFERALSNMAAAVAPGGHLLLLEPMTTRTLATAEAGPAANSLARPARAYFEPLRRAGLRLIALEPATAIGSDPIELGRPGDRFWRWVWTSINRVAARFSSVAPVIGFLIYIVDPILLRLGLAPSEKFALFERPMDD
jgi:hypothetical protein